MRPNDGCSHASRFFPPAVSSASSSAASSAPRRRRKAATSRGNPPSSARPSPAQHVASSQPCRASSIVISSFSTAFVIASVSGESASAANAAAVVAERSAGRKFQITGVVKAVKAPGVGHKFRRSPARFRPPRTNRRCLFALRFSKFPPPATDDAPYPPCPKSPETPRLRLPADAAAVPATPG